MEVKAKSIKDIRYLNLFFNFPDQRPHEVGCKPSSLLGHLVGYEGSGSLFSYLKAGKHWVDGLFAGSDTINAGTEVFVISMSLTQEGLGTNLIIILHCDYNLPSY